MSISLIWRDLYYVWFFSEIMILVITRTRRGAGKVSDRGSLLVLWVVIFGSITACWWIAEATPSNMLGGPSWLQTASLVVLVAGLAIRWSAVLSLGRSFSANVAVREGQLVHKTGLFGLVRHPSYLGLMLVFVAIGLRTRNWYSLAVMVLLPLAALLYRIHVEEQALTEAFGEEYVTYSKVTKRLIPGIY